MNPDSSPVGVGGTSPRWSARKDCRTDAFELMTDRLDPCTDFVDDEASAFDQPARDQTRIFDDDRSGGSHRGVGSGGGPFKVVGCGSHVLPRLTSFTFAPSLCRLDVLIVRKGMKGASEGQVEFLHRLDGSVFDSSGRVFQFML